ncbi:MAG: hypothetical protein R3B72_01315 [Polyangiaceae bacterium]
MVRLAKPRLTGDRYDEEIAEAIDAYRNAKRPETSWMAPPRPRKAEDDPAPIPARARPTPSDCELVLDALQRMTRKTLRLSPKAEIPAWAESAIFSAADEVLATYDAARGTLLATWAWTLGHARLVDALRNVADAHALGPLATYGDDSALGLDDLSHEHLALAPRAANEPDGWERLRDPRAPRPDAAYWWSWARDAAIRAAVADEAEDGAIGWAYDTWVMLAIEILCAVGERLEAGERAPLATEATVERGVTSIIDTIADRMGERGWHRDWYPLPEPEDIRAMLIGGTMSTSAGGGRQFLARLVEHWIDEQRAADGSPPIWSAPLPASGHVANTLRRKIPKTNPANPAG